MLGSFSEMSDPYGPTVRAAASAAEQDVLMVDIHVSSAVFDLLPAELTKKPVSVVPILFTQVGWCSRWWWVGVGGGGGRLEAGGWGLGVCV